MKPIERAIRHLGGQQVLAERLGVSQSFISQIKTGARPVPATLCEDIEILTGGLVLSSDLRPDVFKATRAA